MTPVVIQSDSEDEETMEMWKVNRQDQKKSIKDPEQGDGSKADFTKKSKRGVNICQKSKNIGKVKN